MNPLILDDDFALDPRLIGPSSYRDALAWKYRKARFFSITERSREAAALGFAIIFSAVVLSYFVAHFLLYITGYYQTAIIR